MDRRPPRCYHFDLKERLKETQSTTTTSSIIIRRRRSWLLLVVVVIGYGYALTIDKMKNNNRKTL